MFVIILIVYLHDSMELNYQIRFSAMTFSRTLKHRQVLTKNHYYMHPRYKRYNIKLTVYRNSLTITFPTMVLWQNVIIPIVNEFNRFRHAVHNS